MKTRLLLTGSLLAVALFIAGCATMGTQTPAKVKCPACGYQFEAPADGGR